MADLRRLTYVRPCKQSDDVFLYDVFCTTWQSEVAALPNQNLARHVLRIQHIAQERRFAGRYPGHQRYVLMHEGEAAGRLYLHESGSTMQIVDLTLLPQFRHLGIGSRLLVDLMKQAVQDSAVITTEVGRRIKDVTGFLAAMGFDLVSVDDLDNHFEWRPTSVEAPAESSPLGQGAGAALRSVGR